MKILSLIICLFYVQINLGAINYQEVFVKHYTKHQKQLEAVGLTIAIVKNDKVVLQKNIGLRDKEKNLPVENNTLFRIGSLTKTFTATAIMMLVEKGLISLDTPAEEYLPELKILVYPIPESPRITIRDLLTHNSALVRHPQPEDQTLEGLMDWMLDQQNGQAFVKTPLSGFWYPGYEYLYSNLGVALLGEVVTRVSKTPIDKFIRNEILLPLGMKNTYWHENELPQKLRSYSYKLEEGSWNLNQDWDLLGYSAAGSMYSTTEDLTKWMQFQYGQIIQKQILSPITLHKMHKVQTLNVRKEWHTGTGLIWYTRNKDSYLQTGHNGATLGYKTHFAFDKDLKTGVVVMLSNGAAMETEFAEDLLREIQEKTYAEIAQQAFGSIAEKLIPYLALENLNFTEIFDQSIIKALGSETNIIAIFMKIQATYGIVTKVTGIQASNKTSADILFETDKGHVKYSISLSQTEPGKLSGIRLVNFKPKN